VNFQEVRVGDALPRREFGPLTIVDTVRWAGFQENAERTHWDREFVRAENGLRTFIASGAYRQALLARAITDWIGPRGRLRKMSVRHTAPTFEGDLMIYAGEVTEKSLDPADPWVACTLSGTNQTGEQILTGTCMVLLPA